MGKKTGKVWEFCQSGKVGTLMSHVYDFDIQHYVH